MIKMIKRALALTATIVSPLVAQAQETEQPRQGLQFDVVPQFDPLTGPPGLGPLLTPEEFFATPDGQTMREGVEGFINNFERGVENGVQQRQEGGITTNPQLPNTSPTSSERPQARPTFAPEQEIRVIDRLDNAETVRYMFETTCVSYNSSDLINCSNSLLIAANGIGNAFLQQLQIEANGQGISTTVQQRAVQAACVDRIEAVNQVAQYTSLPQRLDAQFNASGICEETIATQGATVGVNYMPSARALIRDLVDQGNSSSIDFTTWSAPGREL